MNMTREEAIQVLTKIIPLKKWREVSEAIDMAIESLSAPTEDVNKLQTPAEQNKSVKYKSKLLDIDNGEVSVSDMARDLISRADLISELEEWKKNPNNDDSAVDLVNHFIGIIKAEPSADANQVTGKLKNPCDSLLTDDLGECKEHKSKLDLISRKAVNEALDELDWYSLHEGKMVQGAITEGAWYKVEDVYRVIGHTESADRPKGEWITRHDMPKLDNTYSIECSECGQLMFGHYNADNPNYCPNCGAEMRKDQDR